MASKKSKFEEAKEKAQETLNRTNEKIEELGKLDKALYYELSNIQEAFDKIRNVPNEKKITYEEQKQIRLNWKRQVEKIENDYKNATFKNASVAAAGAGVGVTVVTMGPTLAMGVATTFGVSSTGTAISTLSGAAATKAALAWLGGGTLAAGGGGIAAGEAFLALAGPVGWAIAGVAILTSGIVIGINASDKKHIEDVFTLISERNITYYNGAIAELNERITRIKDESSRLHDANDNIRSFGCNYNTMSEVQQYTLGSYVNLMLASTQLLVNPILGLIPKYTETDFGNFILQEMDEKKSKWYSEYELLIVSLANFLYKIELNELEKKLLWKSFRKNKEMLESLGVSEKEFSVEIIDTVIKALNYKYTKIPLL